MASDYDAIRRKNERRYGTDIGRIGKLLFTDTYADRTHFIFELLQNAEDAIGGREDGWGGSQAVSFHLTREQLRVSHFGRPFDEDDVRGICGIGKSTKAEKLTDIGRFGIGFKSVYAFTDRPEVHSGPEDFAIESFVWPRAVPSIDDQCSDETVFLLPFKPDDESAYDQIADGLEKLGASPLLFLRQIEEIEWEIKDGRSGQYLRESERIDDVARRVTVIGQAAGEDDVEEAWLVFSRPVNDDGQAGGQVEIAFQLDPDDAKPQTIQQIDESLLVVFFPTGVETHLGFLVQGPYRTTPSRDNVPDHDAWNQHLARETGVLLREALRWLRDRELLDVEALGCLPLESRRFSCKMFAPLFEETKNALSTEPFLPRSGGDYISAKKALLGRGEGLRKLFSPKQLSALYGEERDWLSGDITEDRAPEVRSYLTSTLDVEEVRRESIAAKLDRTFLETQPDDWIRALYEFYRGSEHTFKRWGFESMWVRYVVPLVRLEKGEHVVPEENGRPQAYLPSDTETDFPTVRASVCSSDEALSFLRSLGLKEPDPVDDVIRNVLPRYEWISTSDISDTDYEKDVKRILAAYDTDSKAQQDKLIGALRNSPFIRTVDAGDGSKSYRKPGDVYPATKGLKELFHGVAGVLLVDDSHECLRGEKIRELLLKCGVEERLRPIQASDLSRDERTRLRAKSGNRTLGRYEEVTDWQLLGIENLLETQRSLPPDEKIKKAKLLWRELGNVEPSAFTGVYKWTYYGDHRQDIDPSSFVRQLNRTAWIPCANGDLKRPEFVVFGDLNWPSDPFLESKIRFKPRVVDELAREAGIEPKAIDFLRERGITADQLRERFGGKPTSANGASKVATRAPDGTKNDDVSQAERPSGIGEGPQTNRDDEDNEPTVSEPESSEAVQAEEPIAEMFFAAQTFAMFDAPPNTKVLPAGGPKTEQTAREDTKLAGDVGRSGSRVMKSVQRWEPTVAAKELAGKFRDYMKGDYGSRCQICDSTFLMRNGQLQAFVVHVVQRSAHRRTNHYGNLLGLCGWHYVLVRYGAWMFVNPETGKRFDDLEDLQRFVANASPEIDEEGNKYFGIEVLFRNLYQPSEPEAADYREEIRYSIPHWKYVRKLLQA